MQVHKDKFFGIHIKFYQTDRIRMKDLFGSNTDLKLRPSTTQGRDL